MQCVWWSVELPVDGPAPRAPPRSERACTCSQDRTPPQVGARPSRPQHTSLRLPRSKAPNGRAQAGVGGGRGRGGGGGRRAWRRYRPRPSGSSRSRVRPRGRRGSRLQPTGTGPIPRSLGQPTRSRMPGPRRRGAQSPPLFQDLRFLGVSELKEGWEPRGQSSLHS